MYYVYMIQCEDGSLYTGLTTDVLRRMRQHLGYIKGGAKYTASHKPVMLMMLWQTEEKRAAARLEYALKRLPRSNKERLINDPAQLAALCPQLEKEAYFPIAGMPVSLTQQKNASC